MFDKLRVRAMCLLDKHDDEPVVIMQNYMLRFGNRCINCGRVIRASKKSPAKTPVKIPLIRFDSPSDQLYGEPVELDPAKATTKLSK